MRSSTHGVRAAYSSPRRPAPGVGAPPARLMPPHAAQPAAPRWRCVGAAAPPRVCATPPLSGQCAPDGEARSRCARTPLDSWPTRRRRMRGPGQGVRRGVCEHRHRLCAITNGSAQRRVMHAAVAQLGERQTEDLKVPSSILGLGIGNRAFSLSALCH